MILISHRGNIDGRNEAKENEPFYLLDAIKEGYDVETDVWFKDHKFFLGHDKPQYEIAPSFLANARVWCHAKNIEALHELLSIRAHCFWHDNDRFTLTSLGFIWTFPGQPLTPKSICMHPEGPISDVAGVCSDNIQEMRK